MPMKNSNFVSKGVPRKVSQQNKQFQSSKRQEEFASDFHVTSEQKQLFEQDFGTPKENEKVVSERTAWN